MVYALILPPGTELHRTCSLSGEGIIDLIKSLSYFQLTHKIVWINYDHPRIEFTLAVK